jgi:hypothetical protein
MLAEWDGKFAERRNQKKHMSNILNNYSIPTQIMKPPTTLMVKEL